MSCNYLAVIDSFIDSDGENYSLLKQSGVSKIIFLFDLLIFPSFSFL